jgi:hypothetical protein
MGTYSEGPGQDGPHQDGEGNGILGVDLFRDLVGDGGMAGRRPDQFGG